MTFRFLSFGAGVQTTALLLMDSYDEVIFSDTKGEWPETYQYLETIILPYVKERGIKFTILDQIVSNAGTHTRSLEDFCLEKKIVPFRTQRWCTAQFKIDRIREYIREKHLEKKPIGIIGISKDEEHRLKDLKLEEYDTERPLVNHSMTVEDCETLIKNHGWPIPPRSHCFYCPFQNKAKWIELKQKHPELYQRAINLEKNGQSYPNVVLFGKHSLEESMGITLEDFEEGAEKDTCETGYCFV